VGPPQVKKERMRGRNRKRTHKVKASLLAWALMRTTRIGQNSYATNPLTGVKIRGAGCPAGFPVQKAAQPLGPGHGALDCIFGGQTNVDWAASSLRIRVEKRKNIGNRINQGPTP